MATYDPVYRLTVYEQDGVTVLTPRAGSVHSDDFKLATATGVTGFFAYLGTPTGRRGRIDALTRKPDTGLVTFKTLDPRTTPGGSNLSRFITAFMGDVNGREQLGGLKCYIERSTDGAAGTFSDWYTGVIQSVDSDGRLWFKMRIRDRSESLSRKIFRDLPPSSVTYVLPSQLSPIGLSAGPSGGSTSYGSMRITTKNSGVWETRNSVHGQLNFIGVVPQLGNVITQAFFDLLAERISTGSRHAPRLRVRATILTGVDAGQSGHYLVGSGGYTSLFTHGGVTPQKLRNVAVDVLQDAAGNALTGDPNYIALQANGVSVSFDIVYSGEPSENTPLFINDVHPAQLLKDILDGKFGRLSDGEVQAGSFGDTTWGVPYNSSDFTTFIADTTFGLFRGMITEPVEDARKWIEQSIMIPFGLGYYYDETGEVRLLDMRRVASSGSPPTFTTADLVDGATPSKRFERKNAITRVNAFYYQDEEIPRSDYATSDLKYVDLPPSRVRTFKFPLTVLNFADPSLPEKALKIDAVGHHAFFDDSDAGVSTRRQVEARLLRQIEELKGPFNSGTVIHSAEVNIAAGGLAAATVGGLAIWDFDEVADPATNLRGGQRLVRITEISPGSIGTVLTAVDLGEDSVAVGPTLAAISAATGYEAVRVNVPVTVNAAGDPIQIEFNATATSVGTRPAEADPNWQYGETVRSTGTIQLKDLPSGRRIWVRGRSLPQDGDTLKIPSGWVFPSGTGRADLTGLATPNVPTISELTGSTALVSWTNTESDFDIEIHLKQGAAQQRVSRVGFGSTEFLLEGLDQSTTYTVLINYRDFARGGVSAEATSAPFATTATDPTCPSLDGLVILAGRPV